MNKNNLKFLNKIPDNVSSTDYHHNPNIVDAAANVIKKLITCREVIVAAEMQSGKTDVMKRLTYVINNHNDKLKNMGIDIDRCNIHIVICASSIGLKNQLKIKMPENKYRIYHLNDISTFLKNISEHEPTLSTIASSGLVIFDECHCDVEQKKLIDRFRKILNKLAHHNNTLFYRVGFSATPYEQVIAGFPIVIMQPGENYYGLRQMFAKISKNSDEVPVVYQAKNLHKKTECIEFFGEIAVCNYYYIFRLPGKKEFEDKMIINIRNQFKKINIGIDTYIYDMNYKGDINEILLHKPNKPTLIFLKDKLRMGEYLNTEHVYLVHDDPSNTYTHTTVQSLIGRCCGYNKKSHNTIIYCDYDKAWQHYIWIKKNYNIKYIPHDAKYINKKTGTIKKLCFF